MSILPSYPSLQQSQLYKLISKAHNCYNQFTAESMPKFIQSIVKYIHQQPLSQEIIRERLINLRHWQCIFDINILQNILHNQTQVDSIFVFTGVNHTRVTAEALTHCGYNIISQYGNYQFNEHKYNTVSSETLKQFLNLPPTKKLMSPKDLTHILYGACVISAAAEESMLFNSLIKVHKKTCGNNKKVIFFRACLL